MKVFEWSVLMIFFKFTFSKQPNVLLIIADDMGWNDASYHGSNQIPTPNIDALAFNGIMLNRFYTLPSCSPSRSALLTGQYPIRLGFQGMPLTAGQNRHLPWSTVTLPQKLKELGYTNYLIGKWHLGSAFKNVTPTALGFDYHFGYWNGYIGYFNHHAEGYNSSIPGSYLSGLDMHENFKPIRANEGQYATDLFTSQTEKVINKHDGSKPFFLTLAHLAPHTGFQEALEVPNVKENAKKFSYIANPARQLYAGMVSELDKSVGRVMKALADKGALDNTLVIFMSDNGAQTVGIHENFGSNWPLRGLKFTIHDGGVRNLAIMYGPGLQNRGVNNDLMHISDLLPTIYAAAGGDPSTLDKIDGINQWDTLINNAKSNRHDALLNIDEVNHCSGFIGESGRYKLINGSSVFKGYDLYFGASGRAPRNPAYDPSAVIKSDANRAIGGDLTISKIKQLRRTATTPNCRNPLLIPHTCAPNQFCLFDLFTDPCETTNIAKQKPDIVHDLKQRLVDYWNQLVPQPHVLIDSRANPALCNDNWFTWLDSDNSVEDCPVVL